MATSAECDQWAMVRAFGAAGPVKRHRDKLMQFGRLVGSWDLDVIYYEPRGEVRLRTPGTWHFGWALEGRAIADVWMIPPRTGLEPADPPPGEYGLSLRFFDPAIDAWRSTWHGPVNGYVLKFIARQVGDEMVLQRAGEDGRLTRWIFSDIGPSSFHWRAVSCAKGEDQWRLDQEMFATRAAGQADEMG